MTSPASPSRLTSGEKLVPLIASAIQDHNRARTWSRFGALCALLVILPISWGLAQSIASAVLRAHGVGSAPLATAGAVLLLGALIGLLRLTEKPATRYVGQGGGLRLRRSTSDWPRDIFGRPRIPVTALADALVYLPYLFGRLRAAVAARPLRASRGELLRAATLLPLLGDPAGLVRQLAAGNGGNATALDLLRILGFAKCNSLREGARWGPTGKLAGILAPGNLPVPGSASREPRGGGAAPIDEAPPAPLAPSALPAPPAPPGPRQLEMEPAPPAPREASPSLRAPGRVLVRSVWSLPAASVDLASSASRDDRSIAIAEGGNLKKIDGAGRVVSTIALPGPARAVRITPGGDRMAALLASGEVVLADETGLVARIPGETILGTLAIELPEEGRLLATGDILGRLSILDDQGRVLHRHGQGLRIDFLSAAQGTERIATASRLGHVGLYTSAGEKLLQLFLNREIVKVEVDEPGGKILLVVPSEGALIYDVEAESLSTLSVDATVIDADGDAFFHRVLLADSKGRLVLLDDEGTVLWESREVDAPRKVFLSDCGQWAWVVRASGQIECLEILSGDEGGARAIEMEGGPSRPAPRGLTGLALREPAWERNLPAPGGYRSLAVDPRGAGLALLSPEGSVLALDANGNERWRLELGDGTEDLVASEAGGWMSVPCERALHLLRLADGSARRLRIPCRRVIPLAGAPDLLVLGESRVLRRVSPEAGPAWEKVLGPWPWDAASGPTETGRIGIVLDGGVLLVLDLAGNTVCETSFPTQGKGASIAAGPAGFAVASSSGELTLFDPDGRRVASTRLALPAQGVRSVGALILATDRDGNRHVFGPDLVLLGVRPPRPGLSFLEPDPAAPEGRGASALLDLNLWKGLLACRRWDDTLAWQAKVPGSPILLTAGAAGKYALCLTPTRLVCFPLMEESLAAQRAQFLEI